MSDDKPTVRTHTCSRCGNTTACPNPHTLSDCRAAVARADAQLATTVNDVLNQVVINAVRALNAEFLRMLTTPQPKRDGNP